MNSVMRDMILGRDKKCVFCGSKKQPTVQHKDGRALKWEGAPDERYHKVCQLCRPCHWLADRGSSASDEIMAKKREIKEACDVYCAKWEGKEPPEYLAAYAQERVDYEKREARKKKTSARKRKADTKKVGGSKLKRDYATAKKPKAGKIPSKIAAQNERPVLNSLPNSRI